MIEWALHHGDCLDVLPTIDPVDAVVTDPPYGLEFMGKAWDHGVPGVPYWAAVRDALKPGGHLLAFGGTRTHHRLMVGIEDAGFEIRDVIMWVYGSGFPKSHDVGKGIDKAGGVGAPFVSFRDAVLRAMEKNGVSRGVLQAALGNYMLSHYLTAGSQPALPSWQDYQTIRDTVGLGGEWDDLFQPKAEREVVGQHAGDMGGLGGARLGASGGDITTSSTDAAKQWDGWGTALKPAWEPIIVARNPLEGTVAQNVLAHGVGGINIDGCRVALDDGESTYVKPHTKKDTKGSGGWKNTSTATGSMSEDWKKGRWPANLIHDGSDEVTRLMPDDAARFFYCAKAAQSDRNEGIATGRNTHPTVKPLALMRYLVRLVTPPGGVVLDPFMGSGSTGKAADLEGCGFVGIDQDAEACRIAAQRRRAQRGLF